MAEREGFEPSRSFWPLPVFETSALDHYATSPWLLPLDTFDSILNPIKKQKILYTTFVRPDKCGIDL
jgi:hypothetical protein